MNPSYLAIKKWSQMNLQIWRQSRLKISIKQNTVAETVRKLPSKLYKKTEGRSHHDVEVEHMPMHAVPHHAKGSFKAT